MKNTYIHFKKQREIGEVISDTFKFLRENYKLLFTLIFKNTGPAFLILMLAAGYYMYVTLGAFSTATPSNPFLTSGFTENIGDILMAFFILFIALMIYMTLLNGTVLHFIKSYIEHHGEVYEEEVREGAKNDFWNLLGTGVLTSIMIFFGLLVCFFPGVYLAVPLSLALSIMVFDKLSIEQSISKCFSLIKDNWWVTFATLLIIWLLIYLIGIVFSIPAIVYSLVKMFTMVEENSMADTSQMFDWIYILLNMISTFVQYLSYTIMVVSSAFIYFNLNEIKNFTGTYETIDKLGNKEE